jgi:2-C-methyl-D-erythritol 4-phosphate cytidylyltransferase
MIGSCMNAWILESTSMPTTDADSRNRCYALVPCAGTGIRAGTDGPKQYVVIAGRSVVAHTLAALQDVPRLAATLVVLAPADVQFEGAAPDFHGNRAWVERCGGANRAASVAAGLDALAARGAQAHDWVLVHDAARCLVRAQAVDRLIDACTDDAVGGLLALPLADTLKQADTHGRVTATLDRRGKWTAQTPQMFRLGLLRQALAAAGDGVTDEASAIEALGHQPLLVRGEPDNFKLTWPADFALAERLLGSTEEIKAFVPARDFELSLRFYRDLGFTVGYNDGKLALIRRGRLAFLLQDFYVPVHAGNFMMHMAVDELAPWVEAGARLAAQYATDGVRASTAEQRPWGLRDMTLIDPTGVLWRIAERSGSPP